jgi:deoxyribose-phosphate aldolase
MKEISKGDPATAICTVAGFPFGTNTTKAKVYEAVDAVEDGATEIDMVMNIGMLKSGNSGYVFSDIKAVVDAVKTRAIVKVIIETCLLTDEEIVKAAIIVRDAGATFVKTSTGLSKSGATVENVALLHATVGDRILVKAAGGIRDFQTAIAMVRAGADRLGTSAGITIINGRENNALKGY